MGEAVEQQGLPAAADAHAAARRPVCCSPTSSPTCSTACSTRGPGGPKDDRPTPTSGDHDGRGRPGPGAARSRRSSDGAAPRALVAGHLEQQEGAGRHRHPRDLRARRDLRPAHRAARPPRLPASRRSPARARRTGSGTNTSGQDIASQLIYGSRVSLLVGLFGGLLATIIAHDHRPDLRLRRGHDRSTTSCPSSPTSPSSSRRCRSSSPSSPTPRSAASALIVVVISITSWAGPRGPSAPRSSPCATATSSPPPSSPARARGASSSAEIMPNMTSLRRGQLRRRRDRGDRRRGRPRRPRPRRHARRLLGHDALPGQRPGRDRPGPVALGLRARSRPRDPHHRR